MARFVRLSGFYGIILGIDKAGLDVLYYELAGLLIFFKIVKFCRVGFSRLG